MTRPLFPEITVNGTTLSAASIAAEAQNHPAPPGKPGLAWRKAARALAIRQLLLEEAARLGVEAHPQELAPGKVETPEEARIRELLTLRVEPAPVTEEALRAAYDARPERFRAPSLFQPAHILLAAPPEQPDRRAAARAHAEALLQEVRANPRSFAEVARRESACSSREAGGQLGQLVSGDTVPEFEAAMEDAREGAVHDRLVETRYGFHILRMDARARGDILPFDAVRPRLLEACEKASWTKAARAYAEGLLGAADISGIDMAKVA